MDSIEEKGMRKLLRGKSREKNYLISRRRGEGGGKKHDNIFPLGKRLVAQD